jgi:MoxR-like ATPase/DNA-directed RNA polymerase subunit RPC12/RpoP
MTVKATEKRPYICSRCGQTFTSPEALNPVRHNCAKWNLGKEKHIPKTYTDHHLAELIPRRDKVYYPQSISDSTDIEILKVAIENRLNILLLGETGIGKTHCLRHLAYQTKLPYMRVNLNGGTTQEDLIGQWIPKKNGHGFMWVDGVLTRLI